MQCQQPARASAGGGVDRAGRTPAELFCRVLGPVLLLVGILGFIADATFDTGNAVQGDTFIRLFEVNGFHNIVCILSGLFLLGMARNWRTARTGALAFGAIYLVVTIWGLIDGNDILGLISINGLDNVLHILLTVTALAAGLMTRPDRDRLAAR